MVPSSKEELGYFVGFAMSSGDALTFKILKTDMRTILVRSVIRSAVNTIKKNRRVNFNKEVKNHMNQGDELITRRDVIY